MCHVAHLSLQDRHPIGPRRAQRLGRREARIEPGRQGRVRLSADPKLTFCGYPIKQGAIYKLDFSRFEGAYALFGEHPGRVVGLR